MNGEMKRQEYYAGKRAVFLAELKRTGEAVMTVAKRHGVPKGTAFNWAATLRQRESAAEKMGQEEEAGAVDGARREELKPVFAQVLRKGVVEREQALGVCVGGARVEVSAGFDVELFREVISALQGVERC